MLRREMKDAAKSSIRNARPHPAAVTLVFLLMTTGVSLLVQGILTVAYGAGDILYWVSQGYSYYEVFYYYAGRGGTMAFVFIQILIGLYTLVVGYGYLGYTLRVSRGEAGQYGNLLDGFASVGRIIALNFLTALFICLWSLLFVVPGIIAAYRYRMAYYIMLDDPYCGALEALQRSKERMVGHKMDLFVLDVSFFNWILLLLPAAMVGGLLQQSAPLLGGAVLELLSAAWSLWVLPYFSCTQAVFYDNICGTCRNGQDSWFSGPDVKF